MFWLRNKKNDFCNLIWMAEALDEAFFINQKLSYISYLSMKTFVVELIEASGQVSYTPSNEFQHHMVISIV